MNSTIIRRLSVAGCSAFFFLFLAGCAQQRVGSPDFSEISSTDRDVEAGKVPAPVSKFLNLTGTEEKAFSRTGELDANLTEAEQRQVRYHFAKYVRERRSTMEKFLRNSLPYISRSKSVFRSHGMPEDLAYLAFLESGYNPFAVSASNAVGMWQFLAATGRDYGLRQDWWVDERRDPVKSTEAAAQYLSRLYGIFHDWHLAVASYNGGEGKIGRAKNATGAENLHELIKKNDSLSYGMQLREETRLYVPRFLAIAKIMRSADVLGIRPAESGSSRGAVQPFVGLKAKPATDLVELSRRLGMTWKEFKSYNPQFQRSVTPPDRESTVYVPRTRETQAAGLLAAPLSGAGWTWFTVGKKDSAASISSVTGVPAAIISQLNPGTLSPGRRIRVPARNGAVPVQSASFTASSSGGVYDHASAALAELELGVKQKKGGGPRASRKKDGSPSDDQRQDSPSGAAKNIQPEAGSVHVVKRGETAASIARSYGISVRDLAAANGGMKAVSAVAPGSTLKLPDSAVPQSFRKDGRRQEAADGRGALPVATRGRTDSPRASASPARDAQPEAPASLPETHVVQPGDTATKIARKYGIGFGELCKANGGVARMEHLSVGQVVKLRPAAAPAPQVKDVPSKGPDRAGAPSGRSSGRDASARMREASPDGQSSVPRSAGAEAAPSGPNAAKASGAASAPSKKTDQAVPGRAGKAAPAAPDQGMAKPSAPSSPSDAAQAPKQSSGKRAAASPDAARASGGGSSASLEKGAAASAASAKKPSGEVPATYRIEPGDTIWKVARRFGLSPNAILSANGMDSSARPNVGEVIKLK